MTSAQRHFFKAVILAQVFTFARVVNFALLNFVKLKLNFY